MGRRSPDLCIVLMYPYGWFLSVRWFSVAAVCSRPPSEFLVVWFEPSAGPVRVMEIPGPGSERVEESDGMRGSELGEAVASDGCRSVSEGLVPDPLFCGELLCIIIAYITAVNVPSRWFAVVGCS